MKKTKITIVLHAFSAHVVPRGLAFFEATLVYIPGISKDGNDDPSKFCPLNQSNFIQHAKWHRIRDQEHSSRPRSI